jgi:DNA repair ATPase RecN
VTDVLTTDGIDQDELDAQRLAERLRHLRELRSAYDKATADLEARREAGRERIAALQAEIDAENAELAGVVNDAATEFNAAAADLVETGFATPKVLAAKGLATIRIKK